MSFEGPSDESDRPNLSWIAIVVAVVIAAALVGGRNVWMWWWAIFPLIFWVIPMIRRSLESPEQRAARFEAQVERRRRKFERKVERYRRRHPEVFAAQVEKEKRKNDADSLDELVEEKRKNDRNPRYVLIGDGEIMQVNDEEAEAEDETPIEEPRRRYRDDGYI